MVSGLIKTENQMICVFLNLSLLLGNPGEYKVNRKHSYNKCHVIKSCKDITQSLVKDMSYKAVSGTAYHNKNCEAYKPVQFLSSMFYCTIDKRAQEYQYNRYNSEGNFSQMMSEESCKRRKEMIK